MKHARTTSLFIEQTEFVPGLGAALLVTVVSTDAARVQLAVENHVFLPAVEACTNQTSYPRCTPRAWKDIVALARADTRSLLLGEAARHGVLVSPGLMARSLQLLDPAKGNPFSALAGVAGFEQALWEVQEWTSSSELRGLLARAVSSPVPVEA